LGRERQHGLLSLSLIIHGSFKILITMNAAIAKVENTIADETVQTQPDRSASESMDLPPLSDEASLDENTGRRVYRRSVAYFFFGFGYNKNTILTDEP
jgi:hypothetical protein